MSRIEEAREIARGAGIDPGLVIERFSRSGGPGGQNVNKVSSAVALSYPPLGIDVVAEESRSQAMNRVLAWRRLAEKAIALRAEADAERRAARELQRRRNRKRPRALKEKILKAKKLRSEIKKTRRKPF